MALVTPFSADMRMCMRGTPVQRPMFRPVRVVHSAVRLAHSRQASVKAQAFFNFFQAKPAAAGPAGPDPRGKELAADLAKLCAGTDYGLKASPQKKEAIATTVSLIMSIVDVQCHQCTLILASEECTKSSAPGSVHVRSCDVRLPYNPPRRAPG